MGVGGDEYIATCTEVDTVELLTLPDSGRTSSSDRRVAGSSDSVLGEAPPAVASGSGSVSLGNKGVVGVSNLPAVVEADRRYRRGM